MFFASPDDQSGYAKDQGFEQGCRLIAAYCVKNRFPAGADAFGLVANGVFSFYSHTIGDSARSSHAWTCGLVGHPKFSVHGWLDQSPYTSSIVEDYPLPPRNDELEALLRHPDAAMYAELFQEYLRQVQFVTLRDPPSMHGDRAIYQDGDTCFLAACLNLSLHVPELRVALFKAFRIKNVSIEKFTEPHFRLLGNFAGEPLGTTILALGASLREEGIAKCDKYGDAIFLLGMCRSLMRAFMLRVPGFEDLVEDVLQTRGEHNVTGSQRASAREVAHRVELVLTERFRTFPDTRGGFLSAANADERHGVAFVRDMETGAVRVYNWGVSDTHHQLRNFFEIFPNDVEIMAYSLPTDHVRRLGLEAVGRSSVKKRASRGAAWNITQIRRFLKRKRRRRP